MAEGITSRFLNVISLFNGTIPLIAIQMRVVQLGDVVSLLFTTVLDELRRGFEEEHDREVPDRTYWENRGTKKTVGMADELLAILKTLDPKLELKYNKFYIGLARDGQPNNFVIFRPKKNALRIEPEPRVVSRHLVSKAVGGGKLDGMTARGDVTFQTLIRAGIVKPPLRIETTYRKRHLAATVGNDGRITFEGKVYDSPSVAGGYARASVKGPHPKHKL